MPERVQLRRVKGWRMPPNTRRVARPQKWGNPFTVENAIESGFAGDVASARRLCVDAFRDWLTRGPQSEWWFQAGEAKFIRMRADLHELRGKNLACYCPLDGPCHADVLLEAAS